jgi:hypothetical protein
MLVRFRKVNTKYSRKRKPENSSVILVVFIGQKMNSTLASLGEEKNDDDSSDNFTRSQGTTGRHRGGKLQDGPVFGQKDVCLGAFGVLRVQRTLSPRALA